MLKEAVAASLVAIFSVSALDTTGISTYSDSDYTFEIAQETDFGRYDENTTKNEFILPLNIGYAYNNTIFTCEAFIYFPRDDGGYDAYPDNGDMGTSTLYIQNMPLHSVGTYEATFKTTFFGYAPNNTSFEEIVLVFQIDGSPLVKKTNYDIPYSFTFYSRTVQIGCGKYVVEPGTKEFYPYDDRIVFGASRPNGNLTETVYFDETTNALCEDKYLSISEKFKISFQTNLPNDNNGWGSPDTMKASIYIYDPMSYFLDMHENHQKYVKIALESDFKLGGVTNYTDKLSATFNVGGSTYWVNTNTLEMSRTEKEGYKETDKFYFRIGYFEDIKENCEFYLKAEGVGHNQATYCLKLDFLGDHNYFGSCADSDYCMHYGRG